MAEDLYGHLAELGGVIPGWGAVAGLLALAGFSVKQGRAFGRFEGAQKATNEHVAGALSAQDAALKAAQDKLEARIEAHAGQLADTREKLAKLPDRDEIRALFADLKADIARRG